MKKSYIITTHRPKGKLVITLAVTNGTMPLKERDCRNLALLLLNKAEELRHDRRLNKEFERKKR